MPRLPAALLTALALALALATPARAQPQDRPPLPELLQRAGAATSRGVPDLTRLDASLTRDQQLPLFRAVMTAPLDAPYRAGVLGDTFRAAAGSPHELIGLAGAALNVRLRRTPDSGLADIDARLRAAPDPLAASLAWMAATQAGASWVPVL